MTKVACKKCKHITNCHTEGYRCGKCKEVHHWDSPILGHRSYVEYPVRCSVKNSQCDCADFEPTLWYKIVSFIKHIHNNPIVIK